MRRVQHGRRRKGGNMTVQKKPYSKSTIAMSAYNAIAINGGRADKATIFDILHRVQHPLLEIGVLERSLKHLLRRKYITRNGRIFSLIDPQRRIVVNRNLSDVRVDRKGIPRGGWKNWKVRDLENGFVPIEEVIK
jgi:hypothetical protein